MPKFALRFLVAAVALSPAVAWLAPAFDLPAEILSGGQVSTADTSQNAYSQPPGGLDAKQAELFALGHKMFNNRWAFFWFENAEFGRGPTSNAQCPCVNNYVWIEHANGEWTKYSHMKQGTTTVKAGLKGGDSVKEGTYLGDEGHVGCAAPAHLHFEVVVPPSGTSTIGDSSGELKGYGYGWARNPVFCGVAGGVFKDGENYFAAASPDCAFEGSVPLYGACVRDVQCSTGSCNSDGTCQCSSDNHCASTEFCDKGVATLGTNHCVVKKADNAACAAVGGGHQCQSGKCSLGHCYTSQSVAMGGTCYLDDACKEGKCSAIDGTKGSCVCKEDNDCGTDKWCDAGVDTKVNACRAKLDEGESCAGAVGNDHKCKSGKCSGFPNYKCK